MRKNDFFTRVVLYTAHLYLMNAIKQGLELTEEQRSMCFYLGVHLSNKKNTLNRKDSIRLKEIRHEQEDIAKIISEEISYVVFAAELLKRWSLKYPKEKQPALGMPKGLMRKGKSLFFSAMMELRSEIGRKIEIGGEQVEAEEVYRENKQLIDHSEKVAEEWFNWHFVKINGGDPSLPGCKHEDQSRNKKSETRKAIKKTIGKFRKNGTKSIPKKSVFLGANITSKKVILYYSAPKGLKGLEATAINKLKALVSASKIDILHMVTEEQDIDNLEMVIKINYKAPIASCVFKAA